jgi:RimK-like ATP-grasp domain
VKPILLSPWKGGTPRRLCNALGMSLRVPSEMEEVLDYPSRTRYTTLVNWGVSTPYTGFQKILNRAPAVASAANKLTCFRVLTDAGVPTLEFTKDRAEATKWLVDNSVFCHTQLHGHGGSGLKLVLKGETELPQAKVYTRNFAKKTESRTHVIRGPGFVHHMYVEKRRIKEDRYEDFGLEEKPDNYIRTYENGWIFARNVTEDDHAVNLALKTAEVLNLDYCAVDIMRRGGKYVVGEVNTAPGLEGLSLKFYIEHLRSII